MLAEFCAAHFTRPCAEADARPARQARHADGGAGRAVRDRGRVRRSEGRDLPVGQAARRGRHPETWRRPALAAGVAINPGPEWSTDKAYAKSRLRLCFAHPSEERSAKASPRSPRSAAASSACPAGSPTSSNARARRVRRVHRVSTAALTRRTKSCHGFGVTTAGSPAWLAWQRPQCTRHRPAGARASSRASSHAIPAAGARPADPRRRDRHLPGRRPRAAADRRRQEGKGADLLLVDPARRHRRAGLRPSTRNTASRSRSGARIRRASCNAS